jgi:hypothetical protein
MDVFQKRHRFHKDIIVISLLGGTMLATQSHRMRILVPFLVLALALVWVSPAYAAESFCTSDGGTWSGTDADNGTCRYSLGSSVVLAACGSYTNVYEVTYEFDVEVDSVCIPWVSGTRILPPEDPQAGFILRLKGDRNGYVEFFADSCINSCTIDSILPALAKENTIDIPLATLYVRVDGGAGSGSYRVCFDNPYNEGLNLYQFIGGNWWLVNFSHSNPICALASGDGAFYLH